MMNRLGTGLLAGAAALGAAISAHAHGEGASSLPATETPYLVGSLGAQFRTDVRSQGDFGRNTDGSMFLDDVEGLFGLHLTPWFSLQLHIKGEPLRSQRPGNSNAFFGFGLFTEELYANIEPTEWVRLFAGKFNPTFGFAWQETPLIFRKDFAEDYETTEQIGFGAQLTGDLGDFGKHDLTGQLFFNDTTFLHSSVITRPKIGQATTDRPSKFRHRDGGPGNTEKFNNLSLTLDGGGFAWLPDFGYHLGYRRLDRGVTETKVEHGYAAAIEYAWTTTGLLPGKTTFKPSYEVAWFRNAGGQPGKAVYNTPGLIVEWGDWLFGVAATWREFYDDPAASYVRDALYTGAIDYKLDETWRIGLGYKRERSNGAVDHTVGFKIQAGYDFILGLGR